jgi:hypothetical protein
MIMSLLRLLTAGRSLVSVRDTEPRYRVTSQRLLPQFGSGKNPFSGREAATPTQTSAVVAKTEAAMSSVSGEKSSRAKALWVGAAARMSVWTEKLGGRFARSCAKPISPAIPQFNKPPVQGELSLDRVQVMRNDLSDADLEIVPARKKPALVPPPFEAAQEAKSDSDRAGRQLSTAGML